MKTWTNALVAAAAALALAACATLAPSVTLVDVEDEGFRTYLADSFDANGDGRLDADECGAVTAISIGAEYPVETLDVRDVFASLESVEVASPTLVSADISSSSVRSISLMGCDSLASLEVAAPELTAIDVRGCALSSLDLAGSPNVTEVLVGPDTHVTLPHGIDELAAGLARLRSHAWSYEWSRDVPDAWELEVSQAAFEVWFPVFSAEDSIAAAENINNDVASHVRELVDVYNDAVAQKPWGYVYLYPEVTVFDNGYVAVHYFEMVSAGTVGTSYVAGSGAIYRLSDGAAVSPAEFLGISEAELLEMTEEAVAESGIEDEQSYAWGSGEVEGIEARLADGTSEYVLLPEGLYVSYQGVTNWGNDRTFHLVGICALEDHDFDPVRGDLVDLSYEMGRYGAIDRSQGASWTVDEAVSLSQ